MAKRNQGAMSCVSSVRMTSKKSKINEKADMLHLIPLSVEEVVRNEDLLKEILLGVPTKSLVRFKCVSKQWLRIISSARFAFNQFARNTCLTSAIYFNELFKIEARGLRHVSLRANQCIPPLSFLDEIAKGSVSTTLVHSSHGLMLCRHQFLIRLTRYTISNFTTQKYVLIPQLGNSYIKLDRVLACLVFDPATSPYYKVVFVTFDNTNSYVVHIFSSETGSFKIVSVEAPGGETLPHVAYWDGAVHWMNRSKFHFQFEVGTEKFTTTLMPPNPKIFDKKQIRYFGECGGNLLLIQYQSNAQMQIEVLEMKKGTCVWTLMYQVDLRPIIEEDAGLFRNYPVIYQRLHEQIKFNVLGVVKESQKSGLALILYTPTKLISYSLEFKKVDILMDCFPKDFYLKYYIPYSRPFIESLFPVEFGPRILHD